MATTSQNDEIPMKVTDSSTTTATASQKKEVLICDDSTELAATSTSSSSTNEATAAATANKVKDVKHTFVTETETETVSPTPNSNASTTSNAISTAHPRNVTKAEADHLEKRRNVHDEYWRKMFQKLKAYKQEHGDCFVPKKYKEDQALANWVQDQRRQWKLLHKHRRQFNNSYNDAHVPLPPTALTDERIELLEKEDFDWSPNLHTSYNNRKWRKMLDQLRRYKETHGDCYVCSSKDVYYQQLSSWVAYQRKQYKFKMNGQPSTMTKEKERMLEDLGFDWANIYGHNLSNCDNSKNSNPTNTNQNKGSKDTSNRKNNGAGVTNKRQRTNDKINALPYQHYPAGTVPPSGGYFNGPSISAGGSHMGTGVLYPPSYYQHHHNNVDAASHAQGGGNSSNVYPHHPGMMYNAQMYPNHNNNYPHPSSARVEGYHRRGTGEGDGFADNYGSGETYGRQRRWQCDKCNFCAATRDEAILHEVQCNGSDDNNMTGGISSEGNSVLTDSRPSLMDAGMGFY